jgi:hypothetical protein
MTAPRRGYPLGALFVVVATAAVLIAGIAPLVRMLVAGETTDWQSALAAVVSGLICGLFVGATLGLLQFRRLLGLALGSAAGTVIGAAAGAMAMLPANQLLSAAIPMAAGSGLVVGVALLMRRADN